ncbi:cyclase family protein [Microbacterium sp. NPDC078428]|uniref:cyclase family protein n=1 Tax=Microbacterium sp. NPDC078428 TaxID=3364190 RepID=UPI0037CB5FD9
MEHRTLGRELSNWGRWGEADQLGTLNLLTPERRVEAARSIHVGISMDLSLPLDEHGPQLTTGSRGNPVHVMTRLPSAPADVGGFHYFDDALFLHLQGATQLDALAHVAYDGLLYNGVDLGVVTTSGATRLGVENLVGRISGRGVLLDIPRSQGRDSLGPGEPVTAADLDRAEMHAGVAVGPGDLLLVRTGWLATFTERGDRERFFAAEPGLDLSTARWLHERDVAFVASDNWGVEVSPSASGDAMPLHCVLVRDMGMPLGEMFVLDDLARTAASLGASTFHLSCAGLRVTGGVGTPVSPVVTF